MFKTILVATDGSIHARTAVEVASDLAAQYGAKLVLLHVLPQGEGTDALEHMARVEHLVAADHPRYDSLTSWPLEVGAALGARHDRTAVRRAYEVAGKQILERGEDIARRKGVRALHTTIEEGDPVKRILAYAQREHADLIVVGSRGLSDLKGLLMGSVSHKVTQLAQCHCITVK